MFQFRKAMAMKRTCLAILWAGLTLVAAQNAMGQADYPTLQGGQTRTGHNTDPANYNSGRTILQWYVGNNPADPYGTIYVDDDYPGSNAATPGMTYSNTTPAQLVGTAGPSTGVWQTPTNTASEASQYYQPVGAPYAYHFATCVPAASNATPTVPATGTASTWTWTAPLGNLGYTENYGLYMFIPFGYTGSGTGNSLTPQRYFVYTIKYGTGQTYTDVVDTFVSGYGWVRLGGGGYPTNAVFAYDGIHAISVTLYNTIPLDTSGNLTSGTTATAGSYIVYADAFKCVPSNGYYSASPTSAYIRDTTGAPVVDPAGDIDVAPQPNGAHIGRITSVFNQFVTSQLNGVLNTTAQGVVKNYVMDPHTWPQAPTAGAANGVPFASWTWAAAIQSAFNGTVVTPGSPTAGWQTGTVNTFQGAGYEEAPIVSTPANEQTVTYAQASLLTGAYTIYAYFPGNKAPEAYGAAVQYNILIGGTIVYSGTVNEAAGGGWVQLSTQTWNNNQGLNPGALSVQLTNLSHSPADTGKLAYADAVEFSSPTTSYIINSSPVHAQVNIVKTGGTKVLTQVVIVADENGRIHCLDEAGNGDGTTTEYWSYPSTPDPTNPNYQDPNLTNNVDGPPTSSVPAAAMPTQFSLSTAVIRPADGLDSYDRLYITSTNGRVYCIDMEGRGDYSTATLHPGSTPRLWSYPNDYPQQQVPSALGSIRGSLVYGDANNSSNLTSPTIFVPAAQGRIYSLNALGNVTTRSTTVNWTFPALTQPTLPPIEMTPNLAFGFLYFGTLQDPNTGGPGIAYSLQAGTGAVNWSFNGVTNGANSNLNNVVTEAVDDFVAGPASASATLLAEPGAPYPVTPHDSVYFINGNQSVYGFNAETGALLTDSTNQGYTYDDSEWLATCTQNLGINFIVTYDRTGPTGGAQRSIPVVTIPDTTGQVLTLFANVDDYSVFSYAANGGISAFTSLEGPGFGVFGQNITSLAFSNGRMITADDAGYMYVWDNDSANYGLENPGQQPPGNTIPPNSPLAGADAFRYIHMKAITPVGAVALNTVNAQNQGSDPRDTYPQVCGNGVNGKGIFDEPAPPNPVTGLAFEWGETVNILVYDFPYQPANQTSTNGAVASSNGEMVNVRLSQNGKTFYNRSYPAHQFLNPTTAPTTDGRRTQGLSVNLPNGWYDDGYAVIPITFTGMGANATPPGPGVITADITTSALSQSLTGTGPTSGTATVYQEIASDPSPLYARVPYIVNNPLAFTVVDAWSGNATQSTPISHQYAVTTNRYDPAANNNGTVVAGYSGATYPSQFLQSLGFGLDGQSVQMTMYLYDRSLMAETPVGGLRGVRAQSSDMAWQGGELTIYNPLPNNFYPGFEDDPTQYPNVSLDYPNISKDRLAFTAYQTNATTNMLLTGSALNPPTDASGGQLTTNSDPTTRILVPTPVTIALNIPQFQPANNWKNLPAAVGAYNPDNLLPQQLDSAGAFLPQGMFGLLDFYVDPNGGTDPFTSTDAYRQLHVAASIEPDYQLTVGTPTVGLGSLATGTGYSPLDPANAGKNGPFNPWNGIWNSAYQTFTVQNNSNLNLLNLSVAKASTVGTPEVPWLFTSSANDIGAVLDGSLDMWSNLDPLYAPFNPNSNANNVFSQKARVTDGVGTQVVLNPAPRQNPNLGITANALPLNINYPAAATPKISVSLPFGFPAGQYSSDIKIIDDDRVQVNGATSSNDLAQVWETLFGNTSAVEPSTNTDMIVSFTAREARITNSETAYTAPFAPFLYVDKYLSQNYPNANNPAPAGIPHYAPSYSDPAAMRDSYGGVVTAWSQNESQFSNLSQNDPAPTDFGRRITVGLVPSTATFASNGITVGNSRNTVSGINPSQPLRDLDFFKNNGSSWIQHATPNPYPGSSIIPGSNNGAIVAGTESYDSPSFPVTGSKDAISGSDLGYEYMAFLGKAQKSTPSGRINETHVFLTQVKSTSSGVTLDAAGSPLNTTYPTNVPVPGTQGDDPMTAKGKPTVAQTSTGALVMYGATQGTSSGIHYSRYSVAGKGFGPSVPLNFGTGFDSVSQPKATIRLYSGTYSGNANTLTSHLLDLTFTGRLKGEAHSDVYLSQMRLNQIGGDWQVVDASTTTSIETPGAGTPFAYFTPQVNELLSSDGAGVYRARGVQWDRTQQIALWQYSQGVGTDLLLDSTQNNNQANTRNSDRETGIISYDTILGGKVYIDPANGTVRFSQGRPAQGVDVRLTYTPGFLRISKAGSAEAYSDPTGIYENNFTSDQTEWYSQSGQPETGTPQDGRFVFMYGRASGEGQTARPYMTTMRLGIRLPYNVAVAANGLPINGSTGNTTNGLVVSGNKGPYQIDPANARVYFTAVDEDNQKISITYTGVNQATAGPYTTTTTVSGENVTWIGEQTESPVLIDAAINESNLCTFLDPFTFDNQSRPALFWMFYTSTRNGSPDIYMQTIAPRLAPVLK
jgi:hypothetical protein